MSRYTKTIDGKTHILSDKCKTCGACALVTHTPGYVSELDSNEQYYQCIVGAEWECHPDTKPDGCYLPVPNAQPNSRNLKYRLSALLVVLSIFVLLLTSCNSATPKATKRYTIDRQEGGYYVVEIYDPSTGSIEMVDVKVPNYKGE